MNEEFNVVIAEDEKRICSLIKALIDWDGLHLRLVGEAHDGVQALTLLQQEKVDILITDIRMPGVNGLDLTKWVNDHCNQCSVIIISGYKQFDYAYDALRMDVVDFLLKPIKKTEINNAISKIVQKRSVSSPNTSTIQLEVQQFRTSLRRQCIHSFLYNSSLRDVPLETFNKTTGMEFQNGDFVAIILQLYEPNSSLDGHFSRYSTSAVQSQPAFPVGIGDKLRDLLVAGLISKVIDIEAEFIDDTLYCIVNLDPNSRESFIRSLKRIKDILKEHIDVFRYRFLLTVSNFHSNYTAFPTAFQEARMLIPCKCALSGEGPFLWNDFPLPPLTLPKLSLKSECRRAAETRETKQIFYVIHDLIETHSTLFLTDPRLINSFLRQLFDAIWVIASNHTWLTPDALLIMQNYLLTKTPFSYKEDPKHSFHKINHENRVVAMANRYALYNWRLLIIHLPNINPTGVEAKIFQTLINELANRGTSVLVVVAASSEILTRADNLFEFDQEGNCYQKLDHQNHR